MSVDKLKSVVVIANLAPGANVQIAHGLVHDGKPLNPDEVKISNPALEYVSSDTASVTITNTGVLAASGLALCEAWHPVARLFGNPHQDGSFDDRLMAAAFSITSPDVTGGQALIWLAGASLNSTTGLYTAQIGFVGNPVKNGIGDWTLQYAPAFDTDTGFCAATVQDQGGAGQRENITVQSVDTTHLRVRTFQAGAAKDQHFWVGFAKFSA